MDAEGGAAGGPPPAASAAASSADTATTTAAGSEETSISLSTVTEGTGAGGPAKKKARKEVEVRAGACVLVRAYSGACAARSNNPLNPTPCTHTHTQKRQVLQIDDEPTRLEYCAHPQVPQGYVKVGFPMTVKNGQDKLGFCARAPDDKLYWCVRFPVWLWALERVDGGGWAGSLCIGWMVCE